MRKIVLLFLFSSLAVSAFGQQFLWSTIPDAAERYVPINNVVREVMEFYDQYRFYLDFTGFSKDGFIQTMDYGFDDWEWVRDIDKLTVFALRTNLGQGSIVLVMSISRNNVNMVVFTNAFERGALMTHSGPNREQFSRWFRTTMN